jgi:hypothetical protein
MLVAAREGLSLPLTPDLAGAVECALAQRRARLGLQALSDLSFANLYLFREAHQYRWRPGRWPVVHGLTYDGTPHLLPAFPLEEAPREVLQDLLEGADCFFPLAAAEVERLPPGRFLAEAIEADADYLYPADNFRHFQGPALRKKRAQVQRLLAAARPQCRPLTPAEVPLALEVLAQWRADRGKAPGEADDGPCREALALMPRLGLDGTLHLDGERPIGFVLTEPLAPGVRAVRFAKGLDSHVGIYPFMFQDLCLRQASLQWLNFEQDLGLPNFRQAKRAYAPWQPLAKYRIRLAA